MMFTPVSVTERATMLLAGNSGPMTLEGTNTWVLREPGSTGVVVLDPGPLDERHLNAVLDAAERDGGRVSLVLFSHWHPDHTESIDRFVEMTGAPARALDRMWCREADVLQHGETLEVDGLELEIIATPGHTEDSMCVLLPQEGSLLTADTVLGRGTTVIAHPDGALGSYLDSLHTIRRLSEVGAVKRLLPGHGPVVDRPIEQLNAYLTHREERLNQVRAALEEGHVSVDQVVDHVYSGIAADLRFAAEMSVRAQLDYLRV